MAARMSAYGASATWPALENTRKRITGKVGEETTGRYETTRRASAVNTDTTLTRAPNEEAPWLHINVTPHLHLLKNHLSQSVAWHCTLAFPPSTGKIPRCNSPNSGSTPPAADGQSLPSTSTRACPVVIVHQIGRAHV